MGRSGRRERAAGGGAGRGRSGPGRGLLALSGTCEARRASGRKPCVPAAGALVVCAARAAMAKWGQGDPRWIVEEREDGTNVNNWHWCGGRRLGPGRGRRAAGGRGGAARRRSTPAPGGRRFVTAPALRRRAPPESWAKPREGLVPHRPRHLCLGRPSPGPFGLELRSARACAEGRLPCSWKGRGLDLTFLALSQFALAARPLCVSAIPGDVRLSGGRWAKRRQFPGPSPDRTIR